MAEDPNGRVALAERLVRIETGVESLQRGLDALRGYLTDEVTELRNCDQGHEQRLRSLENDNARHTERLGIIAGLQALFTVVSSGLAAWLGQR